MLSEGLDIPPPVLKENADEYFELLAKEEEADKWIEKYSIDTYPNIDNTNKQMSDKKYSIKDSEIYGNDLLKRVLISILVTLIYFFGLFILFVIWISQNLTMSTM